MTPVVCRPPPHATSYLPGCSWAAALRSLDHTAAAAAAAGRPLVVSPLALSVGPPPAAAADAIEAATAAAAAAVAAAAIPKELRKAELQEVRNFKWHV